MNSNCEQLLFGPNKTWVLFAAPVVQAFTATRVCFTMGANTLCTVCPALLLIIKIMKLHCKSFSLYNLVDNTLHNMLDCVETKGTL